MNKETKAALKDIRDAIKGERYADAIQQCEALLKDDPKNAMVYLLLGAAYQNSNKTEAAKHLRKAVEYSVGPPTVALQGLANCAPAVELPNVYKQLLELVPEKANNYYEKLAVVAENSNATAGCFEIFKKEAQTTEGERRDLALKCLAKIWVIGNFVVNSEEEQLYKTALETFITDAPQLPVHCNAYKNYLKLLFKQKDLVHCMQHACEMVKLYPDDIYAYEWICKIYCENYKNSNAATWQGVMKSTIQEYAAQLLLLNENASLGLLVKAIECYGAQQYVAARDLLYKVQTIQLNYGVALELLADTEMALGAYGLAAPWWKQINRVHEAPYAICLSHSSETEKLQQAIDVLLTLPHTDEEILHALARCYQKLDSTDKLKALKLPPLLQAEYHMNAQEGLVLLQSSAESIDLESFNALLLCGKLHIQLRQYDEALTCMFKATRLQPHRSECFCYLGEIYYATHDGVRARKCFEKCIYLNPICEDAVYNLSTIYQQLNEEDLNEILLLNTLKYMKTESSKRVQYKLGLHYLNAKKWDDAIQAFRTAIKLDVDCLIYWESLGDAYSARGSFNSAIRVFQKILEINADHLYAKVQIALIKTKIRMYSEAIEDFDDLLKAHPDYLPGLKGAAEAHIGLADNLKKEHRYGRCKAHLQLAVDHLQRAFLKPENHSMVWLWRLTAYAFLLTARLSPSLAHLTVAGQLAKREEPTICIKHAQLLGMALCFYTCALKLKQNTFLWYELALCAYYNATAEKEEKEVKKNLDLAIKASNMARQHTNRWNIWNLLGVIHMHKAINKLPLAQHCFVQALKLERKSYTTWTNLGVLYLNLGDILLANQAFQRAQQSHPIFPQAWMGQAMIAEAIEEKEEALDLFRHCQQFEYHPQSALGYAHWVCEVISNKEYYEQPHFKHVIDAMYGDIVALDAITWYCTSEEANASLSGLSFQAFLNERQHLYRPAVASYKQAVQKASDAVERDKMYTNLGYLYLKLNEPTAAIAAFNNVTQATFKPIIGLALAYFRDGQHQEAYSVYNSVLKSVAGTDDEKSARILVAMASMVYASQGEADTKTILYQCILLKDSPIQALYSACALGILHNDQQLTVTILSELKKYENQQEHCAHIAYITAQYYLANKQTRRGLTYLLQRIHVYPHCVELRNILANYLLNNCAQQQQLQHATSQIALSAIELTHRSKTIKNDCIADAESLMVASRALASVDKSRSMKLLQRAIHLYPQNQDAWQALLVETRC